MIPTHTQRALITKSVMTETGLTRKARTHPCPRCHVPVLACIDDLGLDAWAWTDPTTPLGELHATLAGLRTWHESFSRDQLIARGSHTILAKPAGVVPVHVQHRCGDPPPPRAPRPPATATTAAPEHPPF